MPSLTSIAALVTLLATGCGLGSDPATPCGSMDLGHARNGTLVTPHTAPVVAITADQPFILHEVCDEETGCYLRRERLEGLSTGSRVLLTSTGEFAIAIDRELGIVNSYEISSVSTPDGRAVARLNPVTQGKNRPRHLVASMRGNNYVLTRTADMRLGRYYPGETQAHLIGDDIANLRVAAVGERYLVGRKIHTGGEESLYLVGVHPDVETGESIRLVRGRTFSRVVLSPGDERIIATSGEGNAAQTLVFSVPDGTLIDRFSGAAVSGRGASEEIPGLRGVSPDGSHLAFRTPTGALAMRNLDLQASCLVRSATAGDHQIAGFAPNGVLYMEASESVGRSRVLAFDPVTRDLVALGEAGHNYRLAAVAAAMPGQPEDGVDEGRDAMRHWAIAVEQGSYTAVSANRASDHLILSDVSFMARDDTGVWLLDSSRDDAPGDIGQTLSVRRIAPTVVDGELRFRNGTQGPAFMDNGVLEDVFSKRVSRNAELCVSTGIPGAWAVRCHDGTSSSKFLSSSSGHTEDPEQPGPADVSDPETPADE